MSGMTIDLQVISPWWEEERKGLTVSTEQGAM